MSSLLAMASVNQNPADATAGNDRSPVKSNPFARGETYGLFEKIVLRKNLCYLSLEVEKNRPAYQVG